MKKYITIAALLAAGTAFANANVESGTYTLSMGQWTTDNSTLYDFLNGAINEGGTLVFDLDINYTGTNCGAYQTLLHVGQKDTGFSIMANGGPKLLVGELHETSDYAQFNHEYGEGKDLLTGNNDVQVIIKGNAVAGTASVAISINGEKKENAVADLDWSIMAWATTEAERNKYSVNVGAPGWPGHLPAQSTRLTAATATFTAVPEPSAFGMLAGLGALALVASRRRRR